jgi:alkylation response protein AidB-like acyl-CoA dehydrogenase
MNRPVSTLDLASSRPLGLHSPELVDTLLKLIAEDESKRERVLPHPVIDLIRKARLGALRLPTSVGGGGSSIRELFEVVIRLGEADAMSRTSCATISACKGFF